MAVKNTAQQSVNLQADENKGDLFGLTIARLNFEQKSTDSRNQG